jgi:hypothetical protein
LRRFYKQHVEACVCADLGRRASGETEALAAKQGLVALGCGQSSLCQAKYFAWLSNPDLSFIKDPSTIRGRYRRTGGGRPHKVASYESRVVDFYDNCLRDGGIETPDTLKTYCKNIE